MNHELPPLIMENVEAYTAGVLRGILESRETIPLKGKLRNPYPRASSKANAWTFGLAEGLEARSASNPVHKPRLPLKAPLPPSPSRYSRAAQ